LILYKLAPKLLGRLFGKAGTDKEAADAAILSASTAVNDFSQKTAEAQKYMNLMKKWT
jgi:hypothetical protein